MEREDKAEIIDRLYDVALDPIRLEDLLEVWESHAAPLRGGGGVAPTDSVIEAHLDRASVFLDRFEATRAEADRDNGGPRTVLDDIPRSAAFVSDGVTLVACNRSASVAFAVAEGAALAALPFDAADVEVLAREIRQVASGRGVKIATLRIRSVATESPVILRISRVAPDAGRVLALVVSTELVWPEGFDLTVQEAFGLTPAEVEIVRGVSLGWPVREIARRRGRSAETVRTQMRSILAKTETHSQSELVRVVLGLMDVSLVRASGADRGPARAVGTAEVVVQAMTARGGRRLEWIEFGAPHGQPCLYMHLDYGLIRWPASAEREAAERGLRVIVPIRAGYGGTSPPAPRVDHLSGIVADYAAVLDHLGVARAVVVALGADLRFAAGLAVDRPDLVAAIIGCAAQLPLLSPAQYERMDKWQRFILANARYAPKVLPFLVKAGFSLARRLGKEKFLAQVNGGSPADMATFSDPEVRAAILAGSEVCLSEQYSAHEAFAAECIGSERDWSRVLHACPVPIRLYQGDQDPQSPEQTIRELAPMYPTLEVIFLPDNGQLLFFREWRRVLDAIPEMLITSA